MFSLVLTLFFGEQKLDLTKFHQ